MLFMSRFVTGFPMLSATLLCAVGCGAGHAHHHLEGPEAAEGEQQPLDPEAADTTSGPVAPGQDNAPAEDDLSGDINIKQAPPVEVEPKEAKVARAALQRITQANNHLGLVLTVAERTSDLPWILALENRSPNDVKLAALPSLIRFEILAPNTETSNEVTPNEATPAPKAEVCGSSPAKSLDEKDTITLPAGEVLIHAFDPRSLCETERAFVSGATVTLSYGFPITTKKLWKNGKLTEIEEEQKAPFLAERIANGTEIVRGLKQLTAEPFTLGRTYPLNELSARADAPENAAEETASDSNTAEKAAAERDPLEVKIFPLGTTSSPESGLVRVQVKNISNKTLLLYMRREAFAYEVAGPAGSTSCQMMPRELSASNQSYSSLAPSSVLNVSTRLAEACPLGTFARPGSYTVAVNFSPTSSGEERKENAFVGTITGSNVATLTVPGTHRSEKAYMRVVNGQAR